MEQGAGGGMSHIRHQPREFEDEAVQDFYDEQTGCLDPHCEFCNGRVDPSRDYRRVTGWLKAGSWDGFKRDDYMDDWAHKACIELSKTVGINQEAFDV